MGNRVNNYVKKVKWKIFAEKIFWKWSYNHVWENLKYSGILQSELGIVSVGYFFLPVITMLSTAHNSS